MTKIKHVSSTLLDCTWVTGITGFIMILFQVAGAGFWAIMKMSWNWQNYITDVFVSPSGYSIVTFFLMFAVAAGIVVYWILTVRRIYKIILKNENGTFMFVNWFKNQFMDETLKEYRERHPESA